MAKRRIAPLTRGRIRMRLLDEADLPMTLAWRNQDHIRCWFFDSHVISSEEHRAWFEGYRERDDDFVFVIEETDALKRPVGQAALYRIDWTARVAEFGRLLIGDRDAQRRGLAREATSLLVSEALGAWDLREIFLECMPANTRALATYEACGFQRDGQADPVVMRRRAAAGDLSASA